MLPFFINLPPPAAKTRIYGFYELLIDSQVQRKKERKSYSTEFSIGNGRQPEVQVGARDVVFQIVDAILSQLLASVNMCTAHALQQEKNGTSTNTLCIQIRHNQLQRKFSRCNN
jgi:hypothetical protein